MGKVNRLMTTSAKKKSAQTSPGKKEADKIDEYNFFLSINGNDSDEVLNKESRNKEAVNNGIIKSKQSIDFFLPE